MGAAAGPASAVEPVPGRAYLIAVALAGLMLISALLNLQPTYVIMAVCGGVVAFATVRWLTQWHVLVSSIMLIVLLVPIGRYGLPITLPFQLEPYRLLVAIVAVLWITSLLAEPRAIRLIPSGLGGPMGAIWIGIAIGIALNLPAIHERGVGMDVAKKISFFISYLVVMLLIGSALRTRAELDRGLKVLVGGTAVVAFFAMVENKTGYNVFNHIHQVMPVFRFQQSGVPSFVEARGSGHRVYASAEHPIALGAVLVMMLPVGVYVAWRHKSKLWWCAVALIGIAGMATVARTAILMLFTQGLFLLAVRPQVFKRVWWMIPPFLVVVNLAVPATFGTIKSSFFPEGGLIAQQNTNYGGDSSNRISDIGPSFDEASKTPWFGQGWGTRVPQKLDASKTRRILDDQWLTLLLEVGITGVLAWWWFFLRNVRLLAAAARGDNTEHGWLLAGLASAILAFAIGMFTWDAFGFPQCTLMMFILAGVGIAARRLGPITDEERAAGQARPA
ncbi:O-antigen ligase family protein [Solirubrobacter taibaiensis]|nr:O-antigen ligase family protein [Solirubrobacter taibaiensis]